MASEASTAASVDAPAVSDGAATSHVVDISKSPTQPAASGDPAEPATVNGDASGVSKHVEETAGPQATTEVNPPDGEGSAEVAEPPSADTAEGAGQSTPATGSKKKDRKSVGGGVPEHKKSKNLNKKKSMPTMHLDCQPGDFYWARLKGYPPWPSVICDEQMLPESLLASRPVSTMRPDGSLRDDFKSGGKNAKERTFPVMFLSTNEFTWMVNTALTPLDPEECKVPANSKMTNALKQAYEIASESHDLDYFKGILKTWQEEEARFEKELREQEEKEAEERERKAAEDARRAEQGDTDEAKAKKKKPRKSKGGEDTEMEDADAPKSSKKRKNEGDVDSAKPKKTPKVTKLNAPKTPNGESSSAKKSPAKSKKKVVQAPKDDEEEEGPQLSEAEKLQNREKAILYLRHRLQKGFLSRDQAPQEAEMAGMADFFTQLEGYESLEPAIIRNTKVHKVLKAIVKLAAIPKEEQYNFKKRSAALLEVWNKRMDTEPESAPASAVEAKAEVAAEKTNGVKTAALSSDAVAPAAEAKEEDEVKADAPKVEDGAVEAKAEAAADQLDEKVDTAATEDKMDVDKEPVAAPVEQSSELGNDAKDEATDGGASLQPTVEDVAEAA